MAERDTEVFQYDHTKCLPHFKQIVLEVHFLERLVEPEFATLARVRDVRMESSTEVFPTALDMPCCRGRADFRLGSFRF